MNKRLSSLTDFFFIRSRKAKIANYSLGGLLAIYLIIIAFPNFLFGYTFKYKNFVVRSTTALGGNIQTILDQAEHNLSAAEIYDESLTEDIYLCNDYFLYSLLAPLARHAFACNYTLVNNIFIAKCDIDRNLANKNDKQDNVSRSLSQLIAHETTHSLIKERLGYWKSRMLPSWKNEGYSEFIGYNNVCAWKEAKQFLVTHKDDNRPSTTYRKYYYAVAYLHDVKKMNFDEIIASNLTFEQVLDRIEQATGIAR